MKLLSTIVALLLTAPFAFGETKQTPDQSCTLRVEGDGSVSVAQRGANGATSFKAEFAIVHSTKPLAPVSVKWKNPIYNLTGWKLADGSIVQDVFKAGDTIRLTKPQIAVHEGVVKWKFTHELCEVDAELALSDGRAEPRLRYTFKAKQAGTWSLAYSGAPEAAMDERVYGEPGRFYDQTNIRPWMPRALVKCDNVQVNHLAARGADTLCIALMNQCDRALNDVSVQLDLARFDNPAPALTATVWRDNTRVSTPLKIENGKAIVSFSPRGITALVINGLKPRVSFQDKLHIQPQSSGASSHTVLKTPFGDAHAIVLDFGNDLTWLYAYLTANGDEVRSAKLHVELPGRTETLSDGNFPFEFSLPLHPGEKTIKLTVEAMSASGQTQRSETIQLLPH